MSTVVPTRLVQLKVLGNIPHIRDLPTRPVKSPWGVTIIFVIYEIQKEIRDTTVVDYLKRYNIKFKYYKSVKESLNGK